MLAATVWVVMRRSSSILCDWYNQSHSSIDISQGLLTLLTQLQACNKLQINHHL